MTPKDRKTDMTTLKAFLAVTAIALAAGATTVAVTAQEHENTKFPHERMMEIRHLMGGGSI
ncbi:MAG: hypothetical protein AAF264_08525 [Pseudomonadota bacterium]